MSTLFLSRYLLATLLTLVADVLWLGVLHSETARNQIRDVQKKEVVVKKLPALFASLLVSLGNAVFCLQQDAWTPEGQASAALYGLIVFGVYDLTNYAIFDDYKLAFAAVDVAYGTLLCSFVYLFVVKLIVCRA